MAEAATGAQLRAVGDASANLTTFQLQLSLGHTPDPGLPLYATACRSVGILDQKETLKRVNVILIISPGNLVTEPTSHM